MACIQALGLSTGIDDALNSMECARGSDRACAGSIYLVSEGGVCQKEDAKTGTAIFDQNTLDVAKQSDI
jgi:hypothetical protein